MTSRTLLPFLLAATLAGCATSTPLPATTAPTLPGNWALQESSGLPAAPDSVRLVLRSSAPREGKPVLEVSGYAGVNNYRGQATLDTGEQLLVIGRLATTRMAGPPERMQFEGPFLERLEQVGRYEWTADGALVLKTLAGETLTFVRTRDGF